MPSTIRKIKITGMDKWRKNNIDYFIEKSIKDGDKKLAVYLMKYKTKKKLSTKKCG